MDAFEEIGDEDDPHDKVTEIQIMKDYASFFDVSSIDLLEYNRKGSQNLHHTLPVVQS
jgi:hypothetical protein